MDSGTELTEKTISSRRQSGVFPLPASVSHPHADVHPDAVCAACEGSVSSLENAGCTKGGVLLH